MTKAAMIKDQKEAKLILDRLNTFDIDVLSDHDLEILESVTLFLKWIETGKVAHACNAMEVIELQTEPWTLNQDFKFTSYATVEPILATFQQVIQSGTELQEDLSSVIHSLEPHHEYHGSNLGLEAS